MILLLPIIEKYSNVCVNPEFYTTNQDDEFTATHDSSSMDTETSTGEDLTALTTEWETRRRRVR